MTDTTQAPLLDPDDGQRDMEMVTIALDRIVDTPAIASGALRASMRKRGQLQPVIVTARRDGKQHRIIDGRRRVAAARALEWGEINAIVYDTGELTQAAIAVSANAIRSANPLTDLDAIEHLLQDGYSETQIAEETGLAVGTIRKRLKLATLPVDLRAGLEEGAIAIGVAQRIASLPPTQQAALVSVLRETGRVTGTDVSTATKITAQTALAGLHDALAATATPTPRDAVERLTDDLAALRRTYGDSVKKKDWIAVAKAVWEATAA